MGASAFYNATLRDGFSIRPTTLVVKQYVFQDVKFAPGAHIDDATNVHDGSLQ